MDPNTTLEEIRRLAPLVAERTPDGDVRRLTDLVRALDESLSRGDALPADWERAGLRTGLAQLQQLVHKAIDNPDFLAFDQGLD
jgi:hypothetical protein